MYLALENSSSFLKTDATWLFFQQFTQQTWIIEAFKMVDRGPDVMKVEFLKEREVTKSFFWNTVTSMIWTHRFNKSQYSTPSNTCDEWMSKKDNSI